MPAASDLLRWTIAFAFLVILLVASASDIQDRRIPNWSVLAIVVLYVGWAFVMPSVSVVSSVEAAAIVFLVTFALSAANIVGAGDSKLMTSIALFAGMHQLVVFAGSTVLFGGALAILSLAARPLRALVMYQMRFKGDFGRGIPYGVAISLGAAVVVARSLACRSVVYAHLTCS